MPARNRGARLRAQALQVYHLLPTAWMWVPAEPCLLMARSVPAGQGCLLLRAPHQEAGMVAVVRSVRGPAAARLDLSDDREGWREVGKAAALRARAG
jgi:hypothetical protein